MSAHPPFADAAPLGRMVGAVGIVAGVLIVAGVVWFGLWLARRKKLVIPPIPAAVFCAARRLYVGTSADAVADDATVRAWACQRWPKAIPSAPADLAFWVMSEAMQDGHE